VSCIAVTVCMCTPCAMYHNCVCQCELHVLCATLVYECTMHSSHNCVCAHHVPLLYVQCAHHVPCVTMVYVHTMCLVPQCCMCSVHTMCRNGVSAHHVPCATMVSVCTMHSSHNGVCVAGEPCTALHCTALHCTALCGGRAMPLLLGQ
jgi:hypothetical protein